MSPVVFGGAMLLVGAAPGAWADDSARISTELINATSRLAAKRVAVMPFSGVTGAESLSGAVVSSRITQRIVASGSVHVLDRDLIEKAVEKRTGVAGRVSAGMAAAMGRSMGIGAVVAGEVLELDNGRLEVHARVIDTRNGRVIAASTGRVEKNWSAFADERAPWNIPVPPIPSVEEGQVVNVSWDPETGRQVEIADCASARDQLAEDERALLDIKARFWAIKLKEPGFSISELKRNPGSEIQDLRLKEVFYSRMRFWHQEDYVPGLTRAEFESLKKHQKLLEGVANYCGI
ncbi:MAG: hypothetical protein HY924_15830 [Elusimicrobia bacterium]|nr:hypothetical protein [Elusimicrobiota bacterium]